VDNVLIRLVKRYPDIRTNGAFVFADIPQMGDNDKYKQMNIFFVNRDNG
jgi:hypothetical protein